MRTLALFAAILLVRTASGADDFELFEKRVRPVFVKNCYSCHAGDKQFGGLRLDSREHLLKGGQSGPAAVPGKPAESLLIKAVRHEGPKMPLGGKLSDAEVAGLEEWVSQGLPWPAEKAPVKAAAGDPAFYEKLIREHWAFQPVRTARPPRSDGNPVDAYIRANLEKSGLKPAAPAQPRDLARRLADVLIGLPPEKAELQRLLDGSSPAAYEKYVDGL